MCAVNNPITFPRSPEDRERTPRIIGAKGLSRTINEWHKDPASPSSGVIDVNLQMDGNESQPCIRYFEAKPNLDLKTRTRILNFPSGNRMSCNSSNMKEM